MWNITEATDEQRQVMIDALTAEKAGYEQNGEKDRAAEVDKQLKLWAKPTAAQKKAAAEAADEAGE